MSLPSTPPVSSRRRNYSHRFAALLAVGLAVAAWCFPYDGALVKLKPVRFPESAASSAAPAPPVDIPAAAQADGVDAVNLAGLDQPLLPPEARMRGRVRERGRGCDLLRMETLAAARAGGRCVTLAGPEWHEFLTEAVRSIRDPDSGKRFAERLSDSGLGVHKSAFFRPDERPISELAERLAPASSPMLAEWTDGPEDEPLWFELTPVPAGVRRGEESGVRGEYDFRVNWLVPDALAYPYRRHTWTLAGLAVFLWMMPSLGRAAGVLRDGAVLPDGFHNPDTVVARRCMLAALAGGVLLFAPQVIDGPAGGFALAMLGLLAGLTGLICAVIFGRRAQRLNRLAAGEGLLASWVYAPEEWRVFCDREVTVQRQEKRVLFWLILGFSTVICGVFVVFDPRAWPAMLGVFAGLNALCGWLAWAAPRWEDQRRRRATVALCLWGESGVYLAGVSHDWRAFGHRLDQVGWQDETRGVIQVIYSYRTRYGRQNVTVHVPVPAGSQDEAARIVEHLSARSG